MSTNRFVALIVDDERLLVELLREMIEGDFPTATIIDAPNGREGFELAILRKPDLIISDLMMPNGDGFEMLRNLHTVGCQSKILVFTGYGLPLCETIAEDCPKWLNNGRMLFASKPGSRMLPAYAIYLLLGVLPQGFALPDNKEEMYRAFHFQPHGKRPISDTNASAS